MTVWKTVLVCVIAVTIGWYSLALITENFQAFTTEGVRRVSITHIQPTVPNLKLEAHDGSILELEELRGRWVLIDFIYTRCMTYCLQLGAEFGQLQSTLQGPIDNGPVVLLSISFDPDIDAPSQLRGYLARFGQEGRGWLVTRPTTHQDLRAVLDAFSVTVLPDEYGGFVHNTGVIVVNPKGQMVAVFDQGNPAAIVSYLRKQGIQ